jgi:hypothetical protein
MKLLGILKKKIRNRAGTAVDRSLEGLLLYPAGGEQVEINGAAMPQIKRYGRAADQIILTGELPDQRQEPDLVCRQNVFAHVDGSIA